MIKRAKKSGAKGYDIILSLSKDLSVAPDEIVNALEKTRLIGMTEWTKRKVLLAKEVSLLKDHFERFRNSG